MTENFPNFIVSVKFQDMYLTYNYETKQYVDYDRLPTDINHFYMPKSFSIKKKEAKKLKFTETMYKTILQQKLKSYSEKLIDDRLELKDDKTVQIYTDWFDNSFKIDNKIFYKDHKENSRIFFKKLLKDKTTKKYKFSEYDDVYYNEYKWFKLCYNAGLTHLKEKGKYYETYGYDFKMSYLTDMNNMTFKIPTKKGKEKHLKELPPLKFLSFGIYRVKITSNNENFKKTFMFSPRNGYETNTLKFAMTQALKYDIKIELIQDGKPNAYIYERKDLITGNELFGNLYYRIKELYQEYKNNSIVKNLRSACWGHINELKKIYKTESEVIKMLEEGIKISSDDDDDDLDYKIVNVRDLKDRTLYELVDTKKPVYKLPIRLLPFITGFSRVKMGKLIDKNNLYDNVIRIQTDSITLSNEFKQKKAKFNEFAYDDKISGDLVFNSVNDYEKITSV